MRIFVFPLGYTSVCAIVLHKSYSKLTEVTLMVTVLFCQMDDGVESGTGNGKNAPQHQEMEENNRSEKYQRKDKKEKSNAG